MAIKVGVAIIRESATSMLVYLVNEGDQGARGVMFLNQGTKLIRVVGQGGIYSFYLPGSQTSGSLQLSSSGEFIPFYSDTIQ
jgi:hypothetical protein